MNRKELESIALAISAARLRAMTDKTAARAVRLYEIRTIAEGMATVFQVDVPRFLRTCGFRAKDGDTGLFSGGPMRDLTPEEQQAFDTMLTDSDKKDAEIAAHHGLIPHGVIE